MANKKSAKSADNSIKAVMFDLDGTLYLGGKLIDGAMRLLDILREKGIDFAFMTNNSSIAPPDYLKKLKKLSLPASENNILTSAEATVLMLNHYGIGPEIFVLGTEKFRSYLENQGYKHDPKHAKAVLVGFDTELQFEKYTTAVRLLHKGAALFASHPDMECPSPDGPLPDAGMLLAAIKAGTGLKPVDIAGKPNKWIVRLARKKFSAKPEQIAVVGDRMATDMRMANRYGMKSILVLSGVTSRNGLKNYRFSPDMVFESVQKIANNLEFLRILSKNR